ncbi:hypothetical protein MCOR25_000844 [Pyricularia grisea]|nr:hypothetical protein MCOR25_000844 [Pyricularia grisea]
MKTVFTALIALVAVTQGAPRPEQSKGTQGAQLVSVNNATGNGTANGGGNGKQSQAGPSADACAAGAILAMGINTNIADQQMELQAVGNVQKALQSNDANAFAQAKATLLQFVQNGIAIRQANQQIAPAGNPAIAGLDVVANAQLTELGLANNLTGNAATDNAILQELTKDFTGGIEQNKKNAAAATQGCPNTGAANNTAKSTSGAKAAGDKGKDAKSGANGKGQAKFEQRIINTEEDDEEESAPHVRRRHVQW